MIILLRSHDTPISKKKFDSLCFQRAHGGYKSLSFNLASTRSLRVKVYDYKLKVNWEFRNVYIVDNVRVRVVSRILTDGLLVYTLFTNCIWLINFICIQETYCIFII